MKRDYLSKRNRKSNRRYMLKNTVEWVQSGRKYFSVLEELIDSSTTEIHLQTYIFEQDETGIRITKALGRAVERGVQVFLFVDAYGSQNLTSEIVKNLNASGIQVKKFGELYSKGRFHIGRRMHQKVAVFDGQTSIVGGINISDNYNDTKEGKAWLDFAVIINGEASKRLLNLCRRRWNEWHFPFRNKNKFINVPGKEITPTGQSPIRVSLNDFIRNKKDIISSYKEALKYAEQSIVIVGGYFLPGGKTRRLIKSAVQRGVNIKILVAEKSDVRVLIKARQYLYDWLIRNKIEVYEYQPSNVHGKVIIADEKWTSIGSFDLNNLSTYSNIELNVDIDDEHFSKDLSVHINDIFNNDCKRISGEIVRKRKSIFSQFILWVSYHFVKSLFVLSVLLAGKKEKEF